MYKGFKNAYYNGHRIFVRCEYESCHRYQSEEDRLGEIMDKTYSSILNGLLDCYYNDRSLIYREFEEAVDNSLRKTFDVLSLWHRYESGYVHEITGEYVPDICVKPNRDSWPAWAILPRSNYKTSACEVLSVVATIALGIAALFNMFKGE